MNTKQLLSSACFAVLAAICLPADRLFAQLPGGTASEALQLVFNFTDNSKTRGSSARSLVELDVPQGYIGADPVDPSISTQIVDSSGTAISLTEGNLIETQNVGGTSDSTCSTCRPGQAACPDTHGISLTLTYNSRDADGSRAQLDTVMGFGWTHSFNIFLLPQNGSMFRFGGDGRVTKYKLNPDGSFTADAGYFETLIRQSRDTFVLTKKDRTQFTFALIPGTPFLFGGPIYRLTRIQDRNNSAMTLTYSGGNLTTVSDTYGRTMLFTYDAHRNIASLTDPLGRHTTLTYDASGRKLLTMTDPASKTIEYTYNSLYQLIGKAEQDSRLFSYWYTNGKPTASSDSFNGLNFSLSNPNNWAIDNTALATNQLLIYLPSTTTTADGRGNLWRCEYDSRAYATTMTAPDGAITGYTYNAVTRMVSTIRDPNNHITTYAHDSQGNVTRITLTAPFNYVTTFTYEPVFNMMTSMTDPKGRVTSYSYDGHGNRVMETDPLLQTRQWTYDTQGNVLSETSKRGNTITYHYDADGNRDSMTAPPPLGYNTRMTHDSVGNLKTRIDPNNHTTAFDYDDRNRLITEIDPAGKATRTYYDGQSNRTATSDRNEHNTFFEYDRRQRLITTTDALGQMTTSTYDGNNNRTSTTDKNGHTTIFEYDLQNRLGRTKDAEGNVSTMTYDPAGNVTSSTDANLHRTIYTYDALNRRSTVTDALGYVTTYEYDMGGMGCGTCGATPGSSLITKRTDGNGKVTYFKYDPLDRVITIVQKEGDVADVIDASDAVTRHTYDGDNNRLSTTEPNGNTTVAEYDVLSRPIREVNAAGDVTRHTYDGMSNRITSIAPNGNLTTNTYDALDRVVRVDDSTGRVVSSTYDNVGNRLSETDGNNNTTRYTFDAINRPTIVTDPLDRTTVTQYDPVGNIVAVTDREGNTTTSIFDDLNRRISSTDALSHATQYQYDRVGNVLTITDANGHATQYQYDNINRVIRETYADPLPNTRTLAYDAVNLISRTDQMNRTTTYLYSDLYFLLRRTYPVSPADNLTYDLSGRVLTAERAGWVVSFVYDGADRVTQTTQNGKTISYVYDIPGRTRTVTYPGGRSLQDQMDSRNRLTTIAEPTASPIPIVQYNYDLGNRVLTRSYRNNVAATYSYNANDWVSSLEHAVGATRVAGFGYDFDKEGNKKSEQKRHDPGHSEVYQYDNIYRLTDYKVAGTLRGTTAVVTQTAYKLDAVGNWNSKTTDGVTQLRVHNEANELTGIGATNLTYDDNGNLQNDGVYTYAHDEENRLTRVTRNSDSAVAGQYQYDALSRRVKKIASPSGAPTETRFFYDDARIIEEQSAGGATQATYTYGNYIDEVLTMDRGGQTYYYHQNSLWSVEAITNATGTVVERYSYDAYGGPSVFTGSGVPIPPNTWGTPHSAIGNPWLYTGRQLDEETGLYFYRARYLDPSEGRFISRDPIGIWGDENGHGNGYAYVGDRPTSATDPTGESLCTVACDVAHPFSKKRRDACNANCGGGGGGGGTTGHSQGLCPRSPRWGCHSCCTIKAAAIQLVVIGACVGNPFCITLGTIVVGRDLARCIADCQ
jgi:RHS repeat-associated protein